MRDKLITALQKPQRVGFIYLTTYAALTVVAKNRDNY